MEKRDDLELLSGSTDSHRHVKGIVVAGKEVSEIVRDDPTHASFINLLNQHIKGSSTLFEPPKPMPRLDQVDLDKIEIESSKTE